MTTNYTDTFILVAADCPAGHAQIPPSRGTSSTVAEQQHELLSEAPYALTSDELLFAVHALRHGVPDDERDREREAFLAKPQACLRSSPLAKRYGWGFHHDAQGRVALVALGTDEYRRLAADPSVTQVRAMRSKRVGAPAS